MTTIKMTNGTEIDLVDFIADNPDAVFYDASGFEVDADELDGLGSDCFPVRVWETEEESVNDDGASAIGSIAFEVQA